MKGLKRILRLPQPGEREWQKRFEQQRGRPPSEREVWDRRFALLFEGWTDKRWAATRDLRSLLFAAGVTLKPGDARWRLEEVEVVGQTVRCITKAFGQPVSRIIGGVVIKRTHASQWPLGTYWKRCAAWEGMGVVRINTISFAHERAEHVLTHELGHYLQESQDLIDAFVEATGGYQFNPLGVAQFNLTEYRCGGQPPNEYASRGGLYEDFAVSFEAFVYQQINRPLLGSILDSRRRRFFASL
jgi:hypothetical protein